MIPSVHIIRSIDPRSGGPSESVPALADNVARTGRFANRLVHFQRPGEHFIFRPTWGLELARLPWDRVSLLSPLGRRFLRAQIAGRAVAHIHGLWEAHLVASAAICSELNVPFVSSAHGMLDPWALRNKALKKSVYSALVQRPRLQRAACLRALTLAEAHEYHRYGLNNPVAVIPNGVTAPSEISPAQFLEHFPDLTGRRLVLFLSRIHYKKGVDLLTHAWASVSRSFSDAHLVYAGPDFENTLAPTQRLVKELGLNDRITFTGMLKGELKWSALAASELFVLPSHSEGFSVATLEALAAGIPVLITKACNFPDIAAWNCGLVIEPTVEQIENGLNELLRLPTQVRNEMGERGRQLVEKKYSWRQIGEQMADVYDWLLGGPRPSRVEILGI